MHMGSASPWASHTKQINQKEVRGSFETVTSVVQQSRTMIFQICAIDSVHVGNKWFSCRLVDFNTIVVSLLENTRQLKKIVLVKKR